MVLSYNIKFRINMFLNSFKISSLDCKITRTGFYNTLCISSAGDQNFTLGIIGFFFLENRFCLSYVHELLFHPSSFLISCKVFAIFAFVHNNCRFSLVDMFIKCSQLAIHAVLRHRRQVDVTGYAENLWWKQIACFRFPEVD